MKLLYYGCWPGAGVGHGLYEPGGKSIYLRLHPLSNSMDSGFLTMAGAPDKEDRQGWVYVTRIGTAWTILSFWDRSGDHRGNSNSNFVADGMHSYDEVMEAARAQFPTVFARATFPIVRAHIDCYQEPEANTSGN